MNIKDIKFNHSNSKTISQVLGFGKDEDTFLRFTKDLGRFTLDNGVMGTLNKTECLEQFLASQDIEKIYGIELNPNTLIVIGMAFTKALDHINDFFEKNPEAKKELEKMQLLQQLKGKTPEQEHDEVKTPDEALTHMKERHFDEIADMVEKQTGVRITKDMIELADNTDIQEAMQGKSPLGVVKIDAHKLQALREDMPLKRGIKAD